MKRISIILACLLLVLHPDAQQLIAAKSSSQTFPLGTTAIYLDAADHQLVSIAAGFLQKDLLAVTGRQPEILSSLPGKAATIIIIGSLDQSPLIQRLAQTNKINSSDLKGKWEAYTIQTVQYPLPGIANAIILAGSDRRGTAYAVFEFSRQLGVSPWYWWADVPVKKQPAVHLQKNYSVTDAPQIKYRGIFINDEAPALSNWSREKFGGFNHQFYEKVFELILRLKGNYLWPAMWGNAFNTDDTLNPVKADEYGIVMGTSHHEPMLRAQAEWRKFGKGAWDYTKNDTMLRDFWRQGIVNMKNHESIITVGMRGDGDMPMTKGTATELLERIVADQRNIIEEVTKKPASQTPQLWALYKEVQDYYDQGMRVPDDITLLLSDDNWGNLRKLPRLNEKPRKGGYGIYYHFDYVGGPRNYKWLNTNTLPRIWEQMHLAWEYKAREIWIVNVGDIKPMEVPISFFLDYAWNPKKIDAADIDRYSVQWSSAQFGPAHAREIASIISLYAKYNRRRTPELLDANTYSFHYNEWETVVKDYNDLLRRAELINQQLPAEYKDAYFQLVLHPVKACANLNEMYYQVALNHWAYRIKHAETNAYAEMAKKLYEKDSLITLEYHQLNNGKWNHMMSQTHIGYTYWQQPNVQKMPVVYYLPADSVIQSADTAMALKQATYPRNTSYPVFYELDKYVSINAWNFSRKLNSNGITWKLLPDHGRTGSAITPFPVTAPQQVPGKNAAHVAYEFYTYSTGEFTAMAYFSPTLNFHSNPEGLQFAISVDNDPPQIISINKEDKTSDRGIWNKWAAESIIIKNSQHKLLKPGKHVLKYWMVHPGVVLQKIVLDFGGLQPSYFGPPETINKNKTNQP